MKKNIFDKEVNNKLKKKAINERGSVTIFVLATVLFILMVLISVYANKSSKVNSQIVKINNLKEQYEQGPSIDEVYEETNKGDNPVVSFSNNGGGYLIVVGKTNVEVETKISVKDLNGKGIKSVKYQLSMSENFPSESDSNWQSISEEYTMERVLTGGKWYLHVLAIDNVGLKTEQTSQAFTVCYQVKFNGNGGENTPSEQKKEHDKALKLTELKPTATGKTFIGWSRVNNAMEAEYLPGEEYTENAAIELFAVWAENTYTVAYNGNGATSGSMANSSHKYGVSAALNKNTYKKTGYTFVNWNTKADGTGKSYGDGESVINLTENAGEVVTLYAQWRINSYTATFNPNGGGTPKPSKITKNYGEKLGTLPTVEREGWNFEGWYTEAEGGTKITENTTMPSGNVTYYAHWTDIEGPQITSLTANPTTWTNEKVTLTGKAIDKGSGIVEFQFSTNSNLTGDSSGWTQIENTKEEITKTYSVSSNGTYYFYVKDAVGNIAKKEIKVSNIDVTAPTKPVITNSSNGNLTNQNVVVTIKSTDTQSGIARYEWYENGGWTTRAITIKDGVGTITYTADRNNMTIRFRAVDNAGNISEESTTVVNLDKTGPVISSITNSSNGQWTKDPVKLTWTITENGSGIEKVEYGYDGKTWQGNLGTAEWNGLTRSNERNDVLYIRATDKAGNVSNIQSSAMKIDTTLPTVGIGTNGGTYKITAGNTTVNISTTLTAGDEGGSGLKNIQYQISNSSTIPADNDANWKNFRSGASITEAKIGGTWYLYTKVTDNAGNRATTIQKSNAYVVNYQILYNANGGNGEPGEQTKTHGQDLTLSATKPTREGYTFLGWSEDSKATSATYSSGGLYKNNKAVTLYAVWSKGEYSLTVNPNGGTWEGSTGSQQFTQTYGSTKTISNPTAPAGYKVTYNGNGGSTPSAQTSTKSFTGWTTSGAGTLSGTTYTFGAGAGTLTANYKNNAITLPTPTRTGYTFDGWYDAATGGNKVGDGGASYIPTKAITLYAHWTINQYKIDLNFNVDGTPYYSGYNGRIYVRLKIDGEDKGFVHDYGGNYDYGTKWEITALKLDGVEIPYTMSGTLGDSNYSLMVYFYTITIGVNNSNYGKVSASTLLVPNNNTKYTTSGTTLTLSDRREVTATVTESTGYTTTFSSWSPATATITAATNVTANFTRTANSYTATFDANGGGTVTPSSITKKYGEALGTLPTVSRTGYTFNGWFTATSGGQKISTSTTMPATNVTYYAQWSINSYTLTVNPNGGTWEGSTGSQQFTQTYGSTKTISNPTAPAGYKVTYNGNGGSTPSAQTSTKSFTGWTTSGAGTLSGTTYTFGAGAGTLTANYKNNAITLQTPTRTGYTFAGWYDAATGGNKVGNGGASYTPTKAITLYAHWTANTYTVAFNGNGNTGGSTASVSMTYDTAKNLTANGYTKTGYTFKSWNTKPDGSGTTYANSASVKNLTSTNGGTVTLYAQWTANTYTIAFNGNGNTGGSTASVSMTYDTAKNLTANGFTKTGYTFKSWNTKSDGTGTTYANSASVKNLTSTNGGTVTLYAQWTKKQVVVTFMRNTSSTDTTSATQTFTYGTAGQSFSNKNWTRTGYSLLGWSEDKNATTQQYSTLSGVSDSWIDSKSPKVTLYAVWKANSYTATFNSNGGGTPSPSTITKTYGTQLGTLPTVSRTGYTFKGWFTQSTGGEKISTTTTMPANNVTYYAQWTANTYTIEYNANGGTGSTVSSSHTYGVSKALTKNGFTKTGYTFLGWSKDKTATSATYTDEQSVVNISSTNGEKVILYAIWKINSYTVTYNYSANGGTSATKTTATFNYGEAVDLTPVATKSEYTFVGWNTEQTATSKLNSLNMGTNNITLYAIYSKTITATFKYYNNQSESINKTIYNRETTATLTTKGAIGTPSRTYF